LKAFGLGCGMRFPKITTREKVSFESLKKKKKKKGKKREKKRKKNGGKWKKKCIN
jgi:hypothetical protein